MRKSLWVLSGIFLAGAVGWAEEGAKKLPYTVSKETTVVTSPLKTDGSPDYVGALNEKFGKGVTAENNAYAVMLQIGGTESNQIDLNTHDAFLKMLGIRATPADAETWQQYVDYMQTVMPREPDPMAQDDADENHRQAFLKLRLSPWSQKDSVVAADYLKKENGLLDRVVEGSKKARWWTPVVSSYGGLLEVVIPSVSGIRDISHALVVRAALRAGSGDFDGFLSDVTAAKRLAIHVAGGWTMIEHMAAVTINAQADETIGGVAGSGMLTQAQCLQVRKMLESLPPFPATANAIDVGERWSQLYIAEQVSVDDTQLIEYGQIDRDLVDWDLVLKRTNEMLDETVARAKIASLKEFVEQNKAFDAKLDLWKQEFGEPTSLKHEPGETRAAYSERIARFITVMFMPSLGRADVLHRQSMLRDEMVMMVLGAAEMRAVSGKWPAKAGELVPGMMKALPEDIYAEGVALRYRVTSKGVRVYSVGENGKDDGGLKQVQGFDDIGIGVVVKSAVGEE